MNDFIESGVSLLWSQSLPLSGCGLWEAAGESQNVRPGEGPWRSKCRLPPGDCEVEVSFRWRCESEVCAKIIRLIWQHLQIVCVSSLSKSYYNDSKGINKWNYLQGQIKHEKQEFPSFPWYMGIIKRKKFTSSLYPNCNSVTFQIKIKLISI